MQILKVLWCQKIIKKQNPDESYTNKYQKYVTCNFGYKLVFVGDKFSKTF